MISVRAISLAWTLVLASLLCLPSRGAASSCPGAVIGNPNAPPSIQITAVPSGGNSGTVNGIADNIDASKVRVSGWAHTDRYYPQPLLTAPFTCVGGNGSWSYFTNPWKRIIVLLVNDTYVNPAGPAPLPSSIDYHPATDPGVLAWAEIPPSRTLSFTDETWWVKDSAPYATGPGPCVFSPSEGNVFLDDNGLLHLKISKQGSTWTCAEIVLDRSRGYGAYTLQVSSALDKLDAQEVFGSFLFESPTREIDIECSPVLTGISNGCQYVVQPFSTPGNRTIFSIPSGSSSHRISWGAAQIEFLSWRGLTPFPPDPQDVIGSFVYTGPDNPPPGNERMRVNLWLFNGAPPKSGTGSEIIIQSFEYSCPPEGCASTNNPSVILNLNQLGFSPGDVLTLTMRSQPGVPASGNVADFYLAALVPDGSAYMFDGTGWALVFDGVQVLSGALKPFRANATVTNASETIFSGVMPGSIPPGTYTFVGFLVSVGGDPVNTSNWLSAPGQVTFDF